MRPAPFGTSAGLFPFDGPVSFLTADNPHGVEVAEVVNARHRAALADALDDLRLTWLPALGGDPDDPDHLEPGAVVLDLHPAAAADLGARFGQAAVYVWTPRALHLVACFGDRHEVLGYRASPGSPDPPPRLRGPELPTG